MKAPLGGVPRVAVMAEAGARPWIALQQLGGVNVMGPLLVGLEQSVQIAPLGAKMSEIYNSAIVAAYDIND